METSEAVKDFLKIFLILIVSVLLSVALALKDKALEKSAQKEIVMDETFKDSEFETPYEACFAGLKKITKEKINEPIPLSYEEFLEKAKNYSAYTNIVADWSQEKPLGYWTVYEYGNYSDLKEIMNVKHPEENIKQNLIVFYYSWQYGFEGCGFAKISSLTDPRLANLDIKDRVRTQPVNLTFGRNGAFLVDVMSRKASTTQQMTIVLLIAQKDLLMMNRNMVIGLTEYFPSSLYWKALSSYSPVALLLFLSLSALLIIYEWRSKKKISKRTVFIVLVISILLIGLARYAGMKNQAYVNNFMFLPTDSYSVSERYPRLNPILARLQPESSQCSILFKDSLVNLAHIVKTNDTYTMACEYGITSRNLKYENSKRLPVFMGLMRKCDPETAKLIDDSIKGRNGERCVFPLQNASLVPKGLNDYYVFYLACNGRVLQKTNSTCMSEISPGGIYYSGPRGVIDLRKGIMYQ